MKLTTSDYEPGCIARSYVHFEDEPYPPPPKDVRLVLCFLPEIRGSPRTERAYAQNLASTLDELDIDPAAVAELMDPGSTKLAELPTPGDSAADVTFESKYEYEYEYLGDVATIQLALQTDTPFCEAFVGWRVDADAGVVAGTTGEFGSLCGNKTVKLLDVGQGVEFDDDEKCPIIAGTRFEALPVPGRMAREIVDRLSEMRILTEPGEGASLESDFSAFPPEIVDAGGSGRDIREPVAWDTGRLTMWYSNPELSYFDPIPYQIEDGMIIGRTHAHRYTDCELPDTREELLDRDEVKPIAPKSLAE